MRCEKKVPRACCERPVGPPTHAERRERQPEYSGFVIVRLSRELPTCDAEDLREVAHKLDLGGLANLLDQYDLPARRVVRGQRPEELRRLEAEAAQSELPPLRSLTNYWRIDMRHRAEEVGEIVKHLSALHGVERAYREFAATDPVVNAADDPYNGDQDYLDAAPTGIDARWAWTQAHGEGAGVAVVDIEQGWYLAHEDLAAKAPTLISGDNRSGIGGYRGDHGTAVLGEIVGVDNTVGVVGVAPAITTVRVASHYDNATATTGHVADALIAAIGVLSVGDIILLEIQRNFYPTEVDDADFDAIRLAVAHGILVVEAAGNGDHDLDAYVDAAGDHILRPGDPDYRESGAIMVGACESAAAHDRWASSNYGARIDCFGWGEDIVSCGYGDLDNGGGNDNRMYTDTFGGTSGASPMIVGAAAILQGMYDATAGVRLSPGQMRWLLSNPATGTAQGAGRAGDIGVMPDLADIISHQLELVADVYVRDNVGDTGDSPSAGGISASPDVIVLPAPVANPTASFGQGSGTENSNTLGYRVEFGQDNSIYVRMKNRGSSDADGVTAAVYWSPVATLLTPDLWNLIGSTPAVNVPVGNTLVVAGPLTWASGDIPATGHYCFMALLDHPEDPAPPLPPGPPHFDWNAFYAFVRNHNNVTWRNFNVIDEIHPPEEPAEFPFLITGAPDEARVFDFEIIQNLPRDAQVRLVVPLALGARLAKERSWKIKLDRERRLATLYVPTARRVPICCVRLPAGARLKATFIVRCTEAMQQGGHELAIRQLWQGEEVGRITWAFHRRKEGLKKR